MNLTTKLKKENKLVTYNAQWWLHFGLGLFQAYVCVCLIQFSLLWYAEKRTRHYQLISLIQQTLALLTCSCCATSFAAILHLAQFLTTPCGPPLGPPHSLLPWDQLQQNQLPWSQLLKGSILIRSTSHEVSFCKINSTSHKVGYGQ